MSRFPVNPIGLVLAKRSATAVTWCWRVVSSTHTGFSPLLVHATLKVGRTADQMRMVARQLFEHALELRTAGVALIVKLGLPLAYRTVIIPEGIDQSLTVASRNERCLQLSHAEGHIEHPKRIAFQWR